MLAAYNKDGSPTSDIGELTHRINAILILVSNAFDGNFALRGILLLMGILLCGEFLFANRFTFDGKFALMGILL